MAGSALPTGVELGAYVGEAGVQRLVRACCHHRARAPQPGAVKRRRQRTERSHAQHLFITQTQPEYSITLYLDNV